MLKRCGAASDGLPVEEGPAIRAGRKDASFRSGPRRSRLEKLAADVSSVVEHRVDPLQVAVVLIERDLDQLSDRELVATVTKRVS